MKKGFIWPVVIVSALAIHVVASLIVVFIATSDPSYAVEEDYYQKAIHWDDKRDQDRENDNLGWGLDFRVEPPSAPGNQPSVELHLLNAELEPITGAVVSLEAFHNTRGGEIIRGELSAEADGIYRSTFPMERNGKWEMRFTVELDGETFTHSETRHLFVQGNLK